MPEIVMPSLGADMDAGKLVEWRVGPGDEIARGDIVAVVETQKAAMEVESFAAGIIDELLIEPGTKVPVGTPIARYREPGATEQPPKKPRKDAHLRMSPAARQRARELDIDPHTLEGSGPHGAIVMRDVVEAGKQKAEVAKAEEPKLEVPKTETPKAEASRAEAPSPPTPTAETAPTTATSAEVTVPTALTPVPTTPLREAIGAAMSRSKREIPHYYLSHSFSVKRALDWLAAENQKRPVTDRILPAALLLKAVASALWDVPELNGLWIDGQLLQSEAVQLGTAVALRGGGVIAPAIPDAEQKSIGEVMASLRDVVHRARAGARKQSELAGATITVTNVGDRGSEVVYGVINPPQVAIVGFGAIADRPWVEDGQLVVHPVLTATLSADHRATDGHRGGLFLAAIDRRLQEPETL